MNTRIRRIRDDKGLTRKEFGEKLGVTGDMINNIERGRAEVKEYIIKLVCKEFDVNENWLRTGEGEMYTNKMTEDQTAALLDQFGLKGIEAKIARAYLELDHDTRMYVINHFRKYIEDERSHPKEEVEEEKSYSPKLSHDHTVEELEEEYKKSRLDAVKKKA